MQDLPRNAFKHALANGQHQLGYWCSMPNAHVVEMLSNTAFDWLLLDAEHTPAALGTVMSQLQAGAAGTASLIVRAVQNDTALIKQYLDLGAQTLLLPMVNTADEARAAVAAMRYPPKGVRGVATLTRASRYGRVSNYHARAEEELCLLVQVETRQALEQIEEIAGVEGVDGVFIGPSDLAASLGYLGDPLNPVVVETIRKAIASIQKMGKPAGILSTNEPFLRQCREWGTLFTAVGVDAATLLDGAEALAANYADLD